MPHAQKFTPLLLFAALAFTSVALAQSHSAVTANWVSSWGTSQQIPEPHNALPPEDLTDATLRQIFHLSIGGPALRIHLSNAFGTEALHIASVHIASPLSTSSSSIDPASDRPLTFAGNPQADIPPGAELLSDPIDYPVAPLSDLAVTFHLQSPPARETGHPGSRATSWYVHGNLVSAPTFTQPKHVDHWYQVNQIDVQASLSAAAIVVLGDSITDGHGATTNGNDRWTDVLAARLQSSPTTHNIGVSNQAIGGNHLLTDGLGPNVLARFDRDVLAPPASAGSSSLKASTTSAVSPATAKSRPPTMPPSSRESSRRTSRSSPAPTPIVFASTVPPSLPMSGQLTTTPARSAKPTARPSTSGSAPRATSTPSSISTPSSAIPSTPTNSFPPTTAETTSIPPQPDTKRWPTPSH